MKIKSFLLISIITLTTNKNAAAFSSANINNVYRSSHHNHSCKTNMDTRNNSHRKMLPIGPIFDASIAETIQNAGILVSSEQNHEAQVYADLAHLILDCLTLVSGDGIVLQILIFLGRICSILSDYVPDHKMTCDELIFQSVMLMISVSMLFETAKTTLSSLHATTSFKDKRIYKVMFFPAGFTWMQYKRLLSSNVVQWVHYKPGTSIPYNCSLLITYQGEVLQVNDGSTFTRRYGVIGDLSQVPQFSKSSLERRESLVKDLNNNDHDRILRAGKEGLTLLKIDTKKLFEHGSEDMKISENAKNLYFNAMQKVLVSYSEASSFPSSYPLRDESHVAKRNVLDSHLFE